MWFTTKFIKVCAVLTTFLSPTQSISCNCDEDTALESSVLKAYGDFLNVVPSATCFSGTCTIDDETDLQDPTNYKSVCFEMTYRPFIDVFRTCWVVTKNKTNDCSIREVDGQPASQCVCSGEDFCDPTEPETLTCECDHNPDPLHFAMSDPSKFLVSPPQDICQNNFCSISRTNLIDPFGKKAVCFTSSIPSHLNDSHNSCMVVSSTTPTGCIPLNSGDIRGTVCFCEDQDCCSTQPENCQNANSSTMKPTTAYPFIEAVLNVFQTGLECQCSIPDSETEGQLRSSILPMFLSNIPSQLCVNSKCVVRKTDVGKNGYIPACLTAENLLWPEDNFQVCAAMSSQWEEGSCFNGNQNGETVARICFCAGTNSTDPTCINSY